MEKNMTGKICGTGSWAPDRVWDNNDLAKMVETSDQWIRERTGVVQRHIAKEDEDTVMMAAGAALRALEDAEMKAEEIDLILVATISPTEIMPCVACGVQEQIGAENATCFDLNGACTGSLLALNTAQAYLAQGIYRNALVIGAEKLSGLTDWTDRGTCILFGDGAGAVVLRAEEGGSYAQVTHSIGKKGGALTLQSRNQIRYENDPKAKETYIQMNGKEVFSFAVSKVPEAVKELLSREQVSCEDISYYLLHQANERIIRSAARRLGEDISKFPMNMDRYGNTSSASLLILLDEMKKSGKLQRGDRLVLAGFGGGLTYGASLIEY